MDDRSFVIRLPKTWVRAAAIVAVTTLIVAPLTAVATHSFTDVPNSNTFHADIEWLKDAGVTKGCNPPANTEYCPNDNVTRGEMSAFMRRLAENRVVDAGTLDGLEAENLMSHARSISRDGLNGGSILTIPASSTVALATATLDAALGDFALVLYSFYGATPATNTFLGVWIQLNNSNCAIASRVPGTLTRTNNPASASSGNQVALSASAVVSTSGSPDVTFCATSSFNPFGVRDFQFNVLHVGQGTAPVVQSGSPTGPVDADELEGG